MATWSKLFSNFVWKNRPDTSTPLGQTLLNRLNNAINGIDDRVVTLKSQMVSTDELQGVFTNVRLIPNTGQFVFTLYDGTEKIIDTSLEKIAINVSFDKDSQMLVLEKEDGSKEYVDLSAFTTQYEFSSSPTIQQTVTDGKVTANIKPNSITDQMLQTNYLADITTQANTALSASQSALESQSLAEQSAEKAEEEADRAEAAADRAEAVVGITVDTELSASSTNPIANKAVAKEFGKYLPKSGGYLSGNVTIQKSDESEARYTIQNALRTASLLANGSGEVVLYDTELGVIFKSASDGTNTLKGKFNVDGSQFSVVYNKAETVRSYLGNSLRNLMWVVGADGSGGLYDNTNSKFIMNFLANGTTTVNATLTTKPTGSYTGNGDATERTIQTNGIGSVLYLMGLGWGIFSHAKGAIVTNNDGRTITSLPASEIMFLNGILTISTTNERVNGNGIVYTYHVL